MRRRWRLHVADGMWLNIPASGLRIGRDPDCDLVLSDASASKLQALLVPTGSRLLLVPCGRQATTVAGAPALGPTPCLPGAQLVFPGRAVTVEQVGTDDQSWVLDAGDGVRTGLSRDRVRIGGGPDDDVVMRDWPEGALELVAMPTGWVGCVGAEGTVSARPVEAGQVVALDSGDRLCFAATSLTLLSLHGERVASTHLHEDEGLPREVTLAFLPTGGRLTLRFLDKTVTLTLSELRASLVAALLTPRAAAPGEPVEDDELLTRIWPGQSKRGRLDLNQLLHRTRRDLTQAGADGPRLLLRAVTGGATTFQLSKNAAVSVS